MGSLPERLAGPLGPYNAIDFLLPRDESRRTHDLYSVRFMQNGELVGLDTVDDKRVRDRGPMFFLGVLELNSTTKLCLSEQGRQRLCNDLSRRLGGMDVGHFYDGPHFKVKVNVGGELFAEPLGLKSSSTFEIIAFNSSTKLEHSFLVRSMHVQSYALSRCYLSKWSLLREIYSIVNQNADWPLMSRTPRWLVGRYLRAIKQNFHANNEHPTRTARHVHRSEFYNLLVHHRRWLTEKLWKERLLDKTAWERFLLEVKRRLANLADPQAGNLHDVNELEENWHEEDELMFDDGGEPTRNRPAKPAVPNFSNTYHPVGGGGNGPDHAESRIAKASTVSTPDVIAAVPEELYYERPAFPSGSEWRCPTDSCEYVVILREVHGPRFAWMDEEDKKFLRSGLWGPDNDRAVELFYDIVEHHFYEHLERAEVRHLAQRYVGLDPYNEPQHEFVELTGPAETKQEDICYKFEWVKPNHH